MIWSFFTNRITLAVLAVALLATSINLGWQNGVSRRAAVAATKQAAELDGKLTTTEAELTTCETNLFNARTTIDRQNKAIDNVIRSADEAEARARVRIREAQAQALIAQRQVEAVRNFEPNEGESQCDAAFRLHRESIR